MHDTLLIIINKELQSKPWITTPEKIHSSQNKNQKKFRFISPAGKSKPMPYSSKASSKKETNPEKAYTTPNPPKPITKEPTSPTHSSSNTSSNVSKHLFSPSETLLSRF